MNLSDFLIKDNVSLIDALKRLDETARGCLFIADANGRLQGSLTDGDVRRFILTKGTIEGRVSEAANRQPIFVSQDKRHEAPSVMQAGKLTAVPVVDSEHIVVDIIFENLDEAKTREPLESPVPVVMMAGGMGSRLLPFTAILPKPLIPVNGKTIAERIIEKFVEGGCRDFYLILNYKKGMIKAYFDDLEKNYETHYVDETEYLGTGGGVKLLEGVIRSSFILTNCDILVDVDLRELQEVHKRSGNAVTVVCSLKNYTIPYGTIDIEEGGRIGAINEKPTISSLINTGCYMVEPSVFELIGTDESVGFPDVVVRCREAGMPVGVFPVSEGAWLDMGQMDELRHMMSVLDDDVDGLPL